MRQNNIQFNLRDLAILSSIPLLTFTISSILSPILFPSDSDSINDSISYMGKQATLNALFVATAVGSFMIAKFSRNNQNPPTTTNLQHFALNMPPQNIIAFNRRGLIQVSG